MSNPISLEAFADWCSKQPAEWEYDYWDVGRCACAQYAKEASLIFRPEFGSEWDEADGLAGDLPHTFGALTKRLRAHIAAEVA